MYAAFTCLLWIVHTELAGIMLVFKYQLFPVAYSMLRHSFQVVCYTCGVILLTPMRNSINPTPLCF